MALARRLTWIDAVANTDVVRAVRAERRRAELAGQTLVVYVGATWCEPCRYFHDAAVAGKLDQPLGNLRILAFDADRDREQLEPAGYSSKMIPLFALPGPDGRAGTARLAGAIKGPEAVDYLVPRLRTLLESPVAPLAAAPTPAAR
ncbi:MAG: thioredoxin [Deltaproteobacteria bacterium]|nr:thioredoxin [Deltaproteobacteria bacterium]